MELIHEKKKKIHHIITEAHSRRNGFGYDAEKSDEDEHWIFSIADHDEGIICKNTRIQREWCQSIDRDCIVWYTMLHGWNCRMCGNFLPDMYNSFVPSIPMARIVCECIS